MRLELQADCYAGMWTRGATGTTDDEGVQIFESIDQADIDEALDAAKSVGDDRIQKQGGGDVNKEQWTHGSSAERMKWFTTGYNATDIKECDTFSASTSACRDAPLTCAYDQRLDLRELPLQRAQVRGDRGVAVLAGQRALAAGHPGQGPLGAVEGGEHRGHPGALGGLLARAPAPRAGRAGRRRAAARTPRGR